MALNTFGGGPADVTTDGTGAAVGGVQLSVWTTKAMNVQVTTLYAEDGTTPLPGYVTSSEAALPATGRYVFTASDAYSELWLWDNNPATEPWVVVAQEASAAIGAAIAKADQASTDASSALSTANTAKTTADAADTRSTDALNRATSAETTADAAMAAVGRATKNIDELVTPIYIAHRGGALIFPEEALETYRAARAVPGVDVIEADAYLLRDGSLVCMHDTTVDRTTNGTGSTGSYDAGGVQRLRIDAGSWFLSGWPSDLRVPTLGDFLDVVADSHPTIIEAKNTGAGQAIVDMVVARGLQKSTIVQAFNQAELAAATANNIQAMILDSTGAALDFVALVDAGITWAGLSTPSAATITAAKNAGMKVVLWTYDRRVDRDSWLALGADGFFSNDPWYLSERSERLTTDPYVPATFYHGHLGATVASIDSDGTYASSGWRMDSTPGGYASCLQGWACPIKGDPAASAFTIDFTAVFEAVNYGTAWGGVFICAQDDTGYTDSSQAGFNGYHCLFRQNGNLDVYKVTNGTATQVGTVTASSAPAIGAARTYRVQVTATQIIFSAPGTAAPNSVTVTDNAYRGGYFHFGARDAKVRFSGVTVS